MPSRDDASARNERLAGIRHDICHVHDVIAESLRQIEAGPLTPQQRTYLDICRRAANELGPLSAGLDDWFEHPFDADPAGDPEVAPLIPAFLEKRRADAVRLHALIEAGDWPAIQAIGYRMKGTGRGYGFPRISHIGRVLEDAGRHEDAARARAVADALAAYLDRVQAGD